ncbi:MAG: hypothetical protein EP305_04215 [Bacteroidetes bacterium]|nr:MAG: hypothetical protein EP305_04215 [Bacteroidota bacterium]
MKSVALKKLGVTVFVLICFCTSALGQSRSFLKRNEKLFEVIDTLLVIDPSTQFYISSLEKRELNKDIAQMMVDTIYAGLESFSVDDHPIFGRERKLEQIPLNYLQSNSHRTIQLEDSIRVFFENNSFRKQKKAPEFFYDILKESNSDYGLFIYQRATYKNDALFKAHQAGTALLYIFSRGLIDSPSQFSSEFHCVILDRKEGEVIFLGKHKSHEDPLSPETIRYQLHFLFDRLLVQKKS